MSWQNEPATDKQIIAIENMANALGIEPPACKTKLDASDIIPKLKLQIANNIQKTGYINPDNSYLFNSNDSDIDYCFQSY